MHMKCLRCGHSFCSQRSYRVDTPSNRREREQVVTLSGKLVYVCGATKNKNKESYCCKCGAFTTKRS